MVSFGVTVLISITTTDRTRNSEYWSDIAYLNSQPRKEIEGISVAWFT